MIYKFKTSKFSIEETKTAYISPYSQFLIDNFESIMQNSKLICDFGAGTGILGIVASTYPVKKICAVEPRETTYNLLKRNVENNGLQHIFEYLRNANQCNESFDTIICNPASLPNITNVNSFCDGGELGLDMIIETIDFAKKHLTEKGKLYMIVTGILPVSIVKEKILSCDLSYDIIASKKIEFRIHYAGIKEWVDEMKSTYNEMYYISNNGKLYEELYLFEIKRGVQ